MTESELLIKIRSALESGGLDAANSKLKELTSTTDTASVSSGKHHAELQKGARVLSIIKAAAEGNVSAMTRLINETGGVTSAFAKLIPVAGAFWAGWATGTKAQVWLWDQFVGKVKDAGEAALKTKEQFKELDEVKLSKLTSEIDKIVHRLERALKAISDVESRDKSESAAETERQIAAIEADQGKTDPEKQRLIAGIKSKAAMDEYDAVNEASNKREGALRQAKEETDLRIKTAREEISAAEENKKIAEQRYAANPSSYSRQRAFKETRRAADAAQETFGSALPGLEERSRDLGSDIDKEESIQRIAKKRFETAGFQKISSMASIAYSEAEEIARAVGEQSASDERVNKEEKDFGRSSEKDRLAEMKEEAGLYQETLPGMQAKVHGAQFQAQSARAAATPKKGVLGGGVSTSAKKAVSEADQDVKSAEAALQRMADHFASLTAAIKQAEEQMKNANR